MLKWDGTCVKTYLKQVNNYKKDHTYFHKDPELK